MLIAVCLLLAAPELSDLLASKDVQQRLQAIQRIVSEGGRDVETLLQKALKDRDWEVVHRATEALGKRGTKASTSALVELALRGPTHGIRLAAAKSVRRLDPEVASAMIAKRLKGDQLAAAAEALAVLGEAGGTKQLVRMLKGNDQQKRVAAIRALGAQKKPERIELWTKLLADPNILVRVAAVDALVESGHKRAIGPLRDRLKTGNVPQVMERRYIDGIRDLMLGLEQEKDRRFAAELCARTFGMAGSGERDARFARLLGSLGRKEKPIGSIDEYTRALVSTGLANQAFEVRRASVAALARIGADSAYDRIAEVARTDPEAKVRFHALRSAVSLRGGAALDLVLDRTRHDKAIMVREEAATICARLKKGEAAKTLVAALSDPAWEVQTCAAVSLGKLHVAEGVDALIGLYAAKDWRLRGAAVSGLGRVNSKKAIPVLITALRDREPAVAASALEYLRHISGRKMDADVKKWREWWDRHGITFSFPDAGKAAMLAKKYGYAVTRRAVYEDMDIIVLATRGGGDNIQYLLKDYGVEHRLIRAASVNKVGLHPYALFVANCPGEITNKDVERLQWFVRAGGYLFASCWALTHTVHHCFPEVVDKLPLKGQVIGTVKAEPHHVHGPFLEGVFDPATIPLYELEGSHLIRVLDPERFQVLIDSPEAAAIWGDGNLAGWFTVGHGTILDSANHFDLQGMKHAKVRTEEERMAFAVDHLGYSYAELRKLRAEGVFLKGPIAAKRTRDLSIFRFITTFVRQKRLADEQ